MTSEEIVEKLKAGLAGAIQDSDFPQGDAVIFVAPKSLHLVAEFLKNDPDLKFDTFLMCGVLIIYWKNVSRVLSLFISYIPLTISILLEFV